jgi:hypothetical protein
MESPWRNRLMPIYKRDQTEAEKKRSARGKAARWKGAQFERDLVILFNEQLKDFHAERGIQVKGGRGKADVRLTGSLHEFHCETKNQAQPNARKAYQQAVSDSKFGSIPIAITKISGEHMPSTQVTIGLDDFIAILQALEGMSVSGTVKVTASPGIRVDVETRD